MDTVLTRTGDMPAIAAPQPSAGERTGLLGRLLSALANAPVERLLSAQRDVPPEWFRFPLP